MTNAEAWKRLNAAMGGASILEDDWSRVSVAAGIFSSYMDWSYPLTQAAMLAGNATPYGPASAALADVVTAAEGDLEHLRAVLDPPAAAAVTQNMESASLRTEKVPLGTRSTTKAWFSGLTDSLSKGLGGEGGLPRWAWIGGLIVAGGLVLSAFASGLGANIGRR